MTLLSLNSYAIDHGLVRQLERMDVKDRALRLKREKYVQAGKRAKADALFSKIQELDVAN